ncbi:hypothetical protein [Geminocystis sp. NIES-3709]|uniref:hypothetical protein n=1 Tax=Geminocystis sp. NIES-3709 TaxID=1617448 RepID=UPI0005FC80D6|nr:hypothetical protein [Geminocystis sp. NIES-3709]BAQ64543.1 hypothetical protein GM3709_1308 [Geminocystis sp. NIES-3709]
MKNIINQKFLTITILSLGLVTITHNSVNAQSIYNAQQPQPYQSNEKNPLYGNGINPMELIHNANFLNSRTGEDFAEDTNRSLDSAAEDFKQQQLKRMMEMQKQQESPSPEVIDN